MSMFDLNQSIPSGDMMKTTLFQHSLTFYVLQNRGRVTKIYYLKMVHMTMFGLNQSIPSGDMMKTRHFTNSLTSSDLENEVKVTKI